MNDLELVPTPGRWLEKVMEGQGMSRSALARMIGRSREEVQRWVSGREQIPRYHLAEIVRQVGADEDFDYVMDLKTCEDLGDKLKRQLGDLARRAACSPAQLNDAVLGLVLARVSDEIVASSRSYTSAYARHVTDAHFIFRLWTEAAESGDFGAVLGPATIHRHLRYPSNHFFGLALALGEPDTPTTQVGQLADYRAAALATLRKIAESVPTEGPSELVRHHAIHLLARNGLPDDRATVMDIISDAKASQDPLCKRLGYVGLILSSGDEGTLNQYMTLLRRDARLAKADLYFDAIHYGDISLDKNQRLPDSVTSFTHSISNLLRHLEQPERYASITELDSLRLLSLMEISDPTVFRRPEVAFRLQRVFEETPRPPAGSYRRKLESRLFGVMTHHLHPEKIGSVRMTETSMEYDVFIGYHSRDFPDVQRVVDALRAAGIHTWFDRYDLPPGKLFQAEIENVLRSCRSAALFVGPDGVGPWENLEVRAAISQFVGRGLPVIPVMLSDTEIEPILPLFLREFRMVQLESSRDLSVGIEELIWGITGTKHTIGAPA